MRFTDVLHNSDIYDEDNFDLLDSKVYCLSLSDQYWVKRVDEVRDILVSNKLFTRDRIDKIIKQIKYRIDYVNKLKENSGK